MIELVDSNGMSEMPLPAHAGNNQACLASHEIMLRVRYSETDQMGTFYNSRALEWFECGRTELLRHLGIPYAEMERRGAFLPLIEAHVEFLGRARYDDLMRLTTSVSVIGRARLKCDEILVNAETSRPIARGYTIHAFTDSEGRPIRPPAWFLEKLGLLNRQ